MSPAEETNAVPEREGPEPEVPEREAEAPWSRLSSRMLWADGLWSLLSLVPLTAVSWFFATDSLSGNLIPVAVVAVVGVGGAAADALRWVFTRYRVTGEYVELRTGVLVRRRRTVRRDRIRSVDVDARFWHRVVGLRVLTIGAGQQAAAGESAFELDAVSRAEAGELRRLLTLGSPAPVSPPEPNSSPRPSSPTTAASGTMAQAGSTALTTGAPEATAGSARSEESSGSTANAESARNTGSAAAELGRAEPSQDEPVPEIQAELVPVERASAVPASSPDESAGQVRVLAGFHPGWFVYNMFNVWAFVMAAGLCWGAFMLGPSVGLNPAPWVMGLLDTWGLHWAWAVLAGLLVLGAIGSTGLAIAFLAEYWNFELARVPGAKGTLLRTRHGLFRTREVNRDDDRIRGVRISEPVLWRWLGIADTTVVTTGLDEWSMSAPTAVLPRGPVRVARPIAAAVLETADNPMDAPLRPHPRAALVRRTGWAVLTTALFSGALGVSAAMGPVPWAAVWVAPVVLGPLALLGAVIAYRALGHEIADEYVVLRSGLASRSTTALRRSAVSTIVIRESVFQRLLGLRSVATMTAAGAGGYEAPDIAAEGSALFASAAAPGILDPFLVAEGREAVPAG